MTGHLYLTQFDIIEKLAEETFAEFMDRCDFPHIAPIPVEMIAMQLLNLELRYCSFSHFDDHILGALSAHENSIYVDSRSTRHQLVFTIAHEIGHWRLHEGQNNYRLNDSDVKPEHILGSARASSKKNRKRLQEIEANLFAAALLIPQSMLAQQARKYTVLDAHALRELAAIFDVSTRVMIYRIIQLLDYLAWKGPSIDLDVLHTLESTFYPQYSTSSEQSERADAALDASYTSMSSDFDQPSDLIGSRSQFTNETRLASALQHVKHFAKQILPAEVFLDSQVDDFANRREVRHSQAILFPDSKPKARYLSKIIADYYTRRTRKPSEKQERQRPLVIEFAGMPNAGKDTLIDITSDYLQRVYGFTVRVVDEGIKLCHIHKEANVERLYMTVALAVKELYEVVFENPGQYEIIIFNRGLFDRLGFLLATHMQGEISEKQERIHVDYLLSHTHLIDVVFLLFISPEESLRRERRTRTEILSEIAQYDGKDLIDSRIHTMDILEQLYQSYMETYQRYKNFFDVIYPLGMVDGDTTSIVERAFELTRILAAVHSAQLPIPELVDSSIIYRSTPNNNKNSQRGSLSRVKERLPSSCYEQLTMHDLLVNDGPPTVLRGS